MPCAFLGNASGTRHKRTCGNRDSLLAEHSCYHVLRRIWLSRRGEFAAGKCTPRGRCNDAAAGIQPCPACPLRVPQRLLTVE